jgi:glycosyltransferase involved in cell wall biosynthesis
MNEYVYCDIVSFISLFEGFGMPIIEANKIGRPVITSTIPVVREVAGDSAVFVDPYDVNQIENGFSSLFNDQQIRKDCVEKGLKNVTRFDSLVISSQYSQLYNQLRKKV